MVDMQHTDFYKGKNILVTGHTGFKGAWLTTWLTMLGANVHGYSLPPDTDLKAVAIAYFGQQKANVYHRRFLQHKIRMHVTDPSPAWDAVEQQSDQVVEQIDAWLDREPKRVLDELFNGRL